MSVFGQFHLPPSSFALQETVDALPAVGVEIERVVAAEDVVTPYFWVTGVDPDEFESVAGDDPSIEDLARVDDHADSTLFRAKWTDQVDSIAYAYTQIGAVLLTATLDEDGWTLQMRFDGREEVREFQEYCADQDVRFRLDRLHEVTAPPPAEQFDLSRKQEEALRTAWEAGYYETPRRASLEDVAARLDISQQSLSQRLQRGYESLIGSALVVRGAEDSAK